jgi:hypothetical protein
MLWTLISLHYLLLCYHILTGSHGQCFCPQCNLSSACVLVEFAFEVPPSSSCLGTLHLVMILIVFGSQKFWPYQYLNELLLIKLEKVDQRVCAVEVSILSLTTSLTDSVSWLLGHQQLCSSMPSLPWYFCIVTGLNAMESVNKDWNVWNQ